MSSTIELTHAEALETHGAWMRARRKTASAYHAWREVAPESARDAYLGLLAAEECEAGALAALLFPAASRRHVAA